LRLINGNYEGGDHGDEYFLVLHASRVPCLLGHVVEDFSDTIPFDVALEKLLHVLGGRKNDCDHFHYCVSQSSFLQPGKWVTSTHSR
jgi:hypothetical protein